MEIVPTNQGEELKVTTIPLINSPFQIGKNNCISAHMFANNFAYNLNDKTVTVLSRICRNVVTRLVWRESTDQGQTVS